MKTKNELSRIGIGLAGLAAAMATAASAFGAASVHGSICQASQTFDGDVGYTVSNLFGADNLNENAGLELVCPVPVDHNVGTSQQFEARVHDGNTSERVVCSGTVLDTAGNVVCSTATVGTSRSGIGDATLSFSCSSNTSSATYSYVVECSLPEEDVLSSGVDVLRVF